MVISEEHKYLFIEIPLTASWAIRNELCLHYGGQPILHKHATYFEFARHIGRSSKEYFVFGSVRNPLDVIVSQYVKLKNDHKGAFSRPSAVNSKRIDPADVRQHDHVRTAQLSFPEYFRTYRRRPYGGLLELSADHMDFVMRFENLQNDFELVLGELGLRPVRPVPVANRTRGKSRDWASYYPPNLIEQAKRICGPFMARWAYEFPREWGPYQPTRLDEFRFNFWTQVRKLYVENFRYSDNLGASAVRWLRSHVS